MPAAPALTLDPDLIDNRRSLGICASRRVHLVDATGVDGDQGLSDPVMV